MNFNNYNQNSEFDDYEVVDGNGAVAKAAASAFMSKVFTYMFFALLLSGVTAYIIGTSRELLSTLISTAGRGYSFTGLGWVVALSPLAIVIFMSARIQKSSLGTLLFAFILFSVCMGASISYIFAVYEMPHIYSTFFISAATFGAMALVGYTTKTDLTGMGKFLMMALIGLVIAIIVSWFTPYSSTLTYVINCAGVLIFTGLTAYDTQKIKMMGMQLGTHSEMAQKMIIMGALTLYLDFINLFLFMLRFFGGND
jgi:uncharacterized protein